MLVKTLIVLTSTSAIDILFESGLQLLADDPWLLVPRVRLLRNCNILERAVKSLVLEASLGTLESSDHLVVASYARVLQWLSSFALG